MSAATRSSRSMSRTAGSRSDKEEIPRPAPFDADLGILLKAANFQKNSEKIQKKFGSSKKVCTFAIPFEGYAEIAQLVEHNLAKVGVASSSLVFRSKTGHLRMAFDFEKQHSTQHSYCKNTQQSTCEAHSNSIIYAGRSLLWSAFLLCCGRPICR